MSNDQTNNSSRTPFLNTAMMIFGGFAFCLACAAFEKQKDAEAALGYALMGIISATLFCFGIARGIDQNSPPATAAVTAANPANQALFQPAHESRDESQPLLPPSYQAAVGHTAVNIPEEKNQLAASR